MFITQIHIYVHVILFGITNIIATHSWNIKHDKMFQYDNNSNNNV